VDADGLTMACATTAEQRAARRAGLRAELVGLGAKNGIPNHDIVSFGLAGGLGDLPSGTVIDATRVVDEEGQVLWEGDPLGVPGARTGTLLGSDRVIDDPAERREAHRRTGADAVDLESGVLAASGQLAGCLRAISDTPQRTLHGLCNAVHEDGRYAWGGLAKAFARAPIGVSRAGADGKRALDALTRAGERWAT
jgi:adenosylhomocysteine nucleosidase